MKTALALALVLACADVTPPPPLALVPAARFCATAGKVQTRGPTTVHVDIGGMRGVVPGSNGQVAELAFTYNGPSATTAPLASGELRRQIGLKLRAKDTCNVVYVMWHVEPTTGVNVSVKSNPGEATHEQCQDRGYDNRKSHVTGAHIPVVKPGERHVLRARIQNKVLRVTADDVVVFDEALPGEAFTFDGPSGVRSDNGAFDFELRTSTLAPSSATCVRD